MWSIAIGRTLEPGPGARRRRSTAGSSAPPTASGARRSRRDAKISPVNYGGPLVAIDGRVMGVIVPISPSSDGETPGSSGTTSASASPSRSKTSCKVVPKLKAGTPGQAGHTERPGCSASLSASRTSTRWAAPIDTVAPDTPADKVGLKPGDNIVEADGKPVLNQAQLLHVLRPKYEGETVSLKVKRGDKVEEFKEIKLAAAQTNVRLRVSWACCSCATTRSRARRSATSTRSPRPSGPG